MKRSLATIAICALLASCTQAAFASELKVFLNNQAFKGKTSGSPSDLLLEAASVVQMLGLKVELAADATSLKLDEDKEIPVEGGMVKAKDLAAALGGKYDFNKGLSTIDIYAYDPFEAARKSLVRVLRLGHVTSEADFNVCTLLTKQILIQDLGLKLDQPSKIMFLDDKEMLKVSGHNDAAVHVSFRGERRGTGTADYEFHVRKGLSAGQIIGELAWSWGLMWVNGQGLTNNEKYSQGFAYWASYRALAKLTGVTSTSSVQRQAHRTLPLAAQGFIELMEIDHSGGTEAVVKFIQDKRN